MHGVARKPVCVSMFLALLLSLLAWADVTWANRAVAAVPSHSPTIR